MAGRYASPDSSAPSPCRLPEPVQLSDRFRERADGAYPQVNDQRQLLDRHSRSYAHAAPLDFLFWHLPEFVPQPQYWLEAQCESLWHKHEPVGLM